MSVNNYQPHVLVLPEDDANRQIANGFLLEPALNARSIQVLPSSGGWPKVLDDFMRQHIKKLETYLQRRLILMIDFDDQVEERTRQFGAHFPQSVGDRVFLLGTRSHPERLRIACRSSFESIGQQLAKGCVDKESDELWRHELLLHNQTERARLVVDVKPFLFSL